MPEDFWPHHPRGRLLPSFEGGGYDPRWYEFGHIEAGGERVAWAVVRRMVDKRGRVGETRGIGPAPDGAEPAGPAA